MPVIRSAILAMAATLLPVTKAAAQDGLRITFLANEGVLLAGGGRQVLIDALFLSYGPEYAIAADSTQQALAAARPPFDAVDLVLVTHRHGDHFHPVPMAAHLRANSRAVLLTSSQVIDSLRGRLSPGAGVGQRLLPRTTPPGGRRRERVNGVEIEILGLPHAGRQGRIAEHLGYVVEIGGKRVLHVGDTEFTEAVFAPFRLDTARIDVALLPHWVVTSREGREVIDRWIRPRQVVAFHLGVGQEDQVSRAVVASIPGAITFYRSLETRTW